MIYLLQSLALTSHGYFRTWREYTEEDRTKFLENPVQGIKEWWRDVMYEAAVIKCRGTTSSAARKKRRLLELASLLGACETNPELWHTEDIRDTLHVRLWPRPTAHTPAAKQPSSPATSEERTGDMPSSR